MKDQVNIYCIFTVFDWGSGGGLGTKLNAVDG